MKFFAVVILLVGLVAVGLSAPTEVESINEEGAKQQQQQQVEVAPRDKRGVFLSSYTSPLAYTAAYTAPVAYTSAAYSTYPYAYSAYSAYPYYASAYSAPYYLA